MKELLQLCEKLDIRYEQNARMSNYTSFQIGGPAQLLVRPSELSQLQALICFCLENDLGYTVIGKGSNLLVSDEGIRGVVIRLGSEFALMRREGEQIICQAGAPLAALCYFAYQNGLSGLEFAWGIPGSVGGAAYMNAGAYGGEMKDVILSCRYLDESGQICEASAEQLDFSYRHSMFTDRSCCIVSVTVGLKKKEKPLIRETMDDLMNRRRTKQPLEYPSAGSTFKRPEGNYASALIEQCGLKGATVGSAQVSEKHSGFLINLGGATQKDVLALIEKVKETVFAQTGYRLECEVKTLG